MQPEINASENRQPEEPHPVEPIQTDGEQPVKKSVPTSSYVIGALALLLVMAIIGIGGLGYWGYSLGNDLTASQQKLVELQGDYDTLSAQNQKLTADLIEVNTELTATQQELTSVKTELAAKTGELNKKNKNIKDAALRLVVLRKIILPMMGGTSETTEADATTMVLDWIQSIENVKDPTLKEKFNLMAMSIANGTPNNSDFFDYLLQSIEDNLK